MLYPGKFLSIIDPEKAREHLFEDLDPSLRDQLKQGPTVLFVGENFGCGSSREQPTMAMKASHVQCLVGKSFSRIFGRNAVNSGMPAFVNPDAVHAATPGADVEVDLATGIIRIGGTDYPSEAMPALPHAIVMAGGLVPWVRARRRGDHSSQAGAAGRGTP